MEKGIFDLLVDALAHERLDSILLQDSEYQKTVEEIDTLAEALKKLDLSVEEIKAVNRLICAYLTQNACHNKIAYQQGFADCANLLRKIGLI